MIKVYEYQCVETMCVEHCKFAQNTTYYGTRVRGNYGDPVIRVYHPIKGRWILFGGEHKKGNFKNSFVPLDVLFREIRTFTIKNHRLLDKSLVKGEGNVGMYTGLRGKVLIKPEARNAIEQLVAKGTWNEIKISDFFLQRVIQIWCEVGRHDFIPFGGIAYLDWDENDPEWKTSINSEGLFTFQCTLKDYEGEIEYFLKKILPHFTETSYHMEEMYEEWDEPVFYDYVDGAFIRKQIEDFLQRNEF